MAIGTLLAMSVSVPVRWLSGILDLSQLFLAVDIAIRIVIPNNTATLHGEKILY